MVQKYLKKKLLCVYKKYIYYFFFLIRCGILCGCKIYRIYQFIHVDRKCKDLYQGEVKGAPLELISDPIYSTIHAAKIISRPFIVAGQNAIGHERFLNLKP